MRVTVIPSDQTVIVDGMPLRFAFAPPPPRGGAAVSAIQWDGTAGTIEYVRAEPEPIADFGRVLPYVSAWQAERARIEALPSPDLPAPRDLAAEIDALRAQVERQVKIEAALIGANLLTLAEIDAAVPAAEEPK